MWREGRYATHDADSQRLVAVFLAGFVLFNYPVLALFDRGGDAAWRAAYLCLSLRCLGPGDRGDGLGGRAPRAARWPRAKREASPVLQSPIVIGASAVYLALLFAVAYWGDKRADEGVRSLPTRRSTHFRWPSIARPGPTTVASVVPR